MGCGVGRLRICVLGYVVRGPIGGLAWHHLQFVMGLSALGHDVYFIEDSDDYASCYDPSRHVVDADPTYGLDFAGRAFGRVGLGERWAYFDAHRHEWLGPCARDAADRCRSADVVLNVSGVNPLRPWTRECLRRVLIDTDPVFTQVRHLTDADAYAAARQHTHFFTFGENFGTAVSRIPDDGLPWQPTRQPVVISAWPVLPPPRASAFTTVMQWDSYATREYEGQHYGMKSESLRPLMDVPPRVEAPLEIALGGVPAPRHELLAAGWRLVDPLTVTRDPWTYQRYIQQSRGEFSVAKQGYVVAQSGWFSERSACYLASGRPVVVEDTGFSQWLPTGGGVISFSDYGEAIAGIAEVERRYAYHCTQAREVAAAYFESRLVLQKLIDRVYASEPVPVTAGKEEH